MLYFYIKHNN